MLEGIDKLTERKLRQWLADSIKTRSNILGSGYQGSIYEYRDEEHHLAIKAPVGWGLEKLIHRRMLRNEYRAYERLSGLTGIPRCYGILDGRYLVLDYVPGTLFRHTQPTDHQAFFSELLELVKKMHQAGVAHGDFKKQDNLMVVNGRSPCLIDFGVAVIRKQGFAPLNRFLFNLASTFDFNAWIKLKYGGRYEEITDADRPYFKRTRIEKIARWIKRGLVKLRIKT